MTWLLSLDTSSNKTGYAIYCDGSLTQCGLIDCSDIKNADERLSKMVKEIYHLIASTKPNIVVTELTSVNRNPQVQRTLTMILGAVYGRCVSDNIFYYSFRPTEWRKLISSEKKPRKRDELKQWSLDKVKDIFKMEVKSDDIADAILIGSAYVNLFTEK